MSNALHRHQYDVFRQMVIEARLRAGLTQVEVAARLSRHQSFVSKYERGERRLDFSEFMEIANVLGISATSFIRAYRKRLAG